MDELTDSMSVRVPCPACDAWLDVDVVPGRGLALEGERVDAVVLTLAVTQESLEELRDEHGCFTVTDADQRMLDDAFEEHGRG